MEIPSYVGKPIVNSEISESKFATLRCAWVSLVMITSDYSCGAAVAAQSLRNVGTQFPICCLVPYPCPDDPVASKRGQTCDIGDDAIAFLETQFDHVIRCPMITHEPAQMRSRKQEDMHLGWIWASFTKLNILNPELFPAFDRLMFIDADCWFSENCDHLFKLRAPAMTFSSPWIGPYVDFGNERRDPETRFKRNISDNPYWYGREMNHGCIVPQKKILHGLDHSAVAFANMVLVKPNAEIFQTAMNILRAKPTYGHRWCLNGHEEQLFAETFVTAKLRVRHIHQRYNFFTGKFGWLLWGEQPACQQYYNGKPWYDIARRSDVELSVWPDIPIWWAIADQVLASAPTPGAYDRWFYGIGKRP